jgi:sialate O-acetylesterase
MSASRNKKIETLTLPKAIGDNMVLQRGVAARVWGKGKPRETVRVGLDRFAAEGRVGEDGRWEALLGPMEAGGPYDLTVASGAQEIVVRNVCVGEVWVCSGQSNMEMPVGPCLWSRGVFNAAEEIASADYPLIREFAAPHVVAGKPQEDIAAQWRVCSPQTVGAFSAAAYFFARKLFQDLQVPIGLFNSSWGGMPIESFVSEPALAALPEAAPIFERQAAAAAKFPEQLAQFEAAFRSWKRAVAKAEAEGGIVPNPPAAPMDPRGFPTRPGGLYNSMIAPLAPYAVRGALWYQGESNAERACQYRTLMKALINDWRRAWGQPEFTFLQVQLANFNAAGFMREFTWPELREAQTMALALPQTGMAVAIDIGQSADIHPRNKQDVGARLALAAEGIAYGRDVVYSGPLYESMAVEGSRIRLRFRYADGGLAGKDAAGDLRPDVPPQTFEIAGEERNYAAAEARIDGETVIVRADGIERPVAARYAWRNDPVGCNLYNRAGLPASPFRTDDWPEVTRGNL